MTETCDFTRRRQSDAQLVGRYEFRRLSESSFWSGTLEPAPQTVRRLNLRKYVVANETKNAVFLAAEF